LIADIAGRIQWITDNIQNATMGPVQRSRKDVTQNLTWVRYDFQIWHDNEVAELKQLNSSQCSAGIKCVIQFDTSTLLLTGAISGVGKMKTTANGKIFTLCHPYY